MKTPALLLISFVLALGGSIARGAATPRVGETAPNFTLRTLDAKAVELNQLTREGTLVLVMLRGWPGYQCPICTQQVRDFATHAAEFREQKARVVMIYPGPAEQLQAHAREFLQDKQWPADFILVIDPDYAVTNAYGLRWDAKNETAYPSTFIIGADGKIRFAHVSSSHGGRVGAIQALRELQERIGE